MDSRLRSQTQSLSQPHCPVVKPQPWPDLPPPMTSPLGRATPRRAGLSLPLSRKQRDPHTYGLPEEPCPHARLKQPRPGPWSPRLSSHASPVPTSRLTLASCPRPHSPTRPAVAHLARDPGEIRKLLGTGEGNSLDDLVKGQGWLVTSPTLMCWIFALLPPAGCLA